MTDRESKAIRDYTLDQMRIAAENISRYSGTLEKELGKVYPDIDQLKYMERNIRERLDLVLRPKIESLEE